MGWRWSFPLIHVLNTEDDALYPANSLDASRPLIHVLNTEDDWDWFYRGMEFEPLIHVLNTEDDFNASLETDFMTIL